VREQRQIERVISLIEQYNGELPLQVFLRNYFRQHPEMGSNDRRGTSDLVYSWFRMGKALDLLEKEERLAVAAFLTSNHLDNTKSYLIDKYPALNPVLISGNLKSKLEVIASGNYVMNIIELFPFSEDLSQGLSKVEYALSMLIQPYTWIRVNDVKRQEILALLEKNKIKFINEGNRIGIESRINLESKGILKDWYEVQDKSSQLTGEMYLPGKKDLWYDCCAGSGGKSLLLHSIEKSVKITVTDKRESIIRNLKERFRENHIRDYFCIISDLESGKPDELSNDYFDGIIADVPCSGSGTWSRTPEMLSFFDIASLEKYISRQQQILRNVASLVKRGKPLIYSTCSVFFKENEQMVEFICSELNFTCERQLLIKGYSERADTMFVARLIRN
jgi:16S rRNA (cytosine967-C5)-methyltransferase